MFKQPSRNIPAVDIAPRPPVVVATIPAAIVELIIVAVKIEKVVGCADRNVQAQGGDEEEFRRTFDDDRRSADIDIDADIDI